MGYATLQYENIWLSHLIKSLVYIYHTGFDSLEIRRPFHESHGSFSDRVKPFLTHQYLKTEKCTRLKLLV